MQPPSQPQQPQPPWVRLTKRARANATYEPEEASSWYDLAAAKEAHQEVAKLDEVKLLGVGEISTLPYLGIGEPPTRPGGPIRYVGIHEFDDFLKYLEKKCMSEIYVVGCKGIGKSCLLRATACYFLKFRHPLDRIVCIWNMEKAFRNLVAAFKDALTFTYCLEDDVVSVLRGISTLEEVDSFITQRKEQGEDFLFIIDGAQCLDSKDSSGEMRTDSPIRLACKAKLLKVATLATRCIYGLSPKAAGAVEAKRKERTNFYELRDGFSQETFIKYWQNDVMSGIPDRHADDISYLVGAHPLSIARLSQCIIDYVQELDNVPELDNVQELGTRKYKWKPSLQSVVSQERAKECLLDDSDWREVKRRFTESIRKMVPGIVEIVEKDMAKSPSTRKYFSVEEMMLADPRYVMAGNSSEPPKFCTPLIHTTYVKAFRQAQRARYPHGPWLEYCKYLLDNPRGVIWSSMGWLVQQVIEDLFSSDQGLQLGAVYLRNLRVLTFTKVPSSSKWMRLLASEDVSGVICLPSDCGYPYVDAVVIWRQRARDKEGWDYHLHGLQFTVSYKTHMRSAKKFMDLSRITDWIPDILVNPQGWKLHYAFVTCSGLQPEDVPANLIKSGAGIFGTVRYTLEVHEFASVLMHAIDVEAAKTLRSIVEKRSVESAPLTADVPPSALANVLSYLTKTALLKLGAEQGVPKQICSQFKRRKVEPSFMISELVRKLEETGWQQIEDEEGT